jgi:hypothetical protein
MGGAAWREKHGCWKNPLRLQEQGTKEDPMKTRSIFIHVLALAALLSILVVDLTDAQEPEPQQDPGIQAALGNAFTYQGRLLEDGAPANGSYDFEFRLYDAASLGSSVGGLVTVTDQPVVEGRFTVLLDFGDVFDGAALWLEVAVRPGDSSGAYTPLSPRQPLTAAPAAHTLRPGASIVGNLGGESVLYARNTSPDAQSGGLYGESNGSDGAGVYGIGSNGGYGVFGLTSAAASDNTPAVYGQSGSPDGRGVYGYATSDTGQTFGVYGRSLSTEGIGVRGFADAESGPAYGVYGKSDSTAGTGVYGSAAATSGVNYGVYGKSESTLGTGVYGEADSFGVQGVSASTYGIGVYAKATAQSGVTYGLWGQSDSSTGYGVFGVASATSGFAFGVQGRSDSTAGTGVFGTATTTSGSNYGVEGWSESSAGTGVYGYAKATSGTNYGVYGKSNSTDGVGVAGFQTGYDISDLDVSWKPGGLFGGRNGVVGISREYTGFGVYGWNPRTSDVTYGIYGRVDSPVGYAGYFVGDVYVNGDLDATSKSFKIDHPLDPANQYLYHYSVESAERLNQYTGNVTLDAHGQAWVELPDWFQAINADIRYQLTCIGGFAPVYIAQEVQDNRFQIAGGEPGLKVSWLVTAMRNDPYAQQHPTVVEQDKPAAERGTYLDPALYGQPEELDVHYQQQRDMLQP